MKIQCVWMGLFINPLKLLIDGCFVLIHKVIDLEMECKIIVKKREWMADCYHRL